jgi:hypothetical protein
MFFFYYFLAFKNKKQWLSHSYILYSIDSFWLIIIIIIIIIIHVPLHLQQAEALQMQ